jgi:hypothetical protein
MRNEIHSLIAPRPDGWNSVWNMSCNAAANDTNPSTTFRIVTGT